ncbi:MAG: hypothetical protein ABIB47_01240 [Candidatus Woesearchaeota archaeon]
MARCIKCNYLLVLLPKRNKYKCSKCGSLFPQSDIDNKEFRSWNKRQRLEDIENIKPARKPRVKLSDDERKRRTKESAKKWRENNNKRCRELSEKNYYKNRDKILARKKEYRQEIKDKDRIRRKEYRHQQINRTRQLARIHWWRQKQKALALRELKNMEEKACNANIFISPPTILHYHLLTE